MLKTFSLAALFLALAASHSSAQESPTIGSAIAVQNLVTADYNRFTRTLAVGDDVHQNERIEVGTDGQGELKFEDETKLALGPGARITLDKFVYDPEKASGSIIVNLAKGTFRFITGIAAKPTYVIRTPVASITVRGTIFDVFIHDDQTVWLLLHEGAITVCNDRGRCRDLNEPGKLMRVLSNGDVGAPVRWAGLPGADKVPFEQAFPFVVKAPSIDPDPIFTEDTIKLGAVPPPLPGRGGGGDDYTPPPKRNAGGSKPPKVPVKQTEPPRKKPIKTGNKGKDYDKGSGVDAADIAIGIGIGIGIGKAIGGRGKGGKDYGDRPPGRPMGGDRPPKMGGGDGGGKGSYGGGGMRMPGGMKMPDVR